MRRLDLDVPGVALIALDRHEDARGYFCETFRKDKLEALGLPGAWLQDNEALSEAVGTVRGLHFQRPPHAQAKLIRPLVGRIFDVAVDLRRSSPTFGRHIGVTLDASQAEALFIPEGFAHGYCTLTPNTLVAYKTTAVYAPEAEGAILWNDPDLGIAWPLPPTGAVVSPRDDAAPRLAAISSPFA